MSGINALTTFFKPSPELIEAISTETDRLEKNAIKKELGLKENEDIGFTTGFLSTAPIPRIQQFFSKEFYLNLLTLAERTWNWFNPLAVTEDFLTQTFWGGDRSLDPPETQKNSVSKWNEEFLKWLKEEHSGFYQTSWGEIRLENEQLVLSLGIRFFKPSVELAEKIQKENARMCDEANRTETLHQDQPYSIEQIQNTASERLFHYLSSLAETPIFHATGSFGKPLTELLETGMETMLGIRGQQANLTQDLVKEFIVWLKQRNGVCKAGGIEIKLENDQLTLKSDLTFIEPAETNVPPTFIGFYPYPKRK